MLNSYSWMKNKKGSIKHSIVYTDERIAIMESIGMICMMTRTDHKEKFVS